MQSLSSASTSAASTNVFILSMMFVIYFISTLFPQRVHKSQISHLNCNNYTRILVLRWQKLMETFNKHRVKHCNDRGEQTTNLNIQELKGLTKLRKLIKDGSIVVLKTDKFGNLI